MKIIAKLFYNLLLGGLALIIINMVGQMVSFKISLNLVTAAVVGILGIPGFVLLTVLKIIFLR